MTNLTNTVISTRVRLARNIEGYAFPSHLGERQAKEIVRLVTSGVARLDEFKIYYMDKVSEAEALSLQENHLISPNLVGKRNSAALINGDESVSIMVNEEDHLREQCIVKGLDLKLAYGAMSRIDNSISKLMKFAYDEQLGFLTACPTNLGTGLRASVMLFLPAITINRMMPRVVKSISHLGLTVRGIYGEGSQAEGYTYQISNEVTLGVSEGEIIARVNDIVKKVCALEEAERNELKTCSSALDIRDETLRSYGILTNCAKLSTSELIAYSANVKLGACLGYIKLADISQIDELVVKMRPSNINNASGRELTPVERDVYRAQYTAKFLKKIVE